MPLKEDLATEITGSHRLDVWDRFFDPESPIYKWTILQQFWVEATLARVLERQRARCLSLFDRYFTEKARKDAFRFLQFQKTRHQTKPIRWSLPQYPIDTAFQRRTFPKKVAGWLQKGDLAPEAIRIISYVDYEPYRDIFMSNLFESLKTGGDVTFAEFDIPIDFEYRDPNVLSFAEQYCLQLSSHISIQISSQVQAALIEGVRMGESLPLIRDRVLQVWNKPIPVSVEPLIDPVTDEVLRRGYEYQLTAENWAMTTARTEVLRWYNEGKLGGYRQMGVGRVQYTATDDHRTCPDCIAEHDHVYTVDEAAGHLPLHCRCRCTWRPVIGDASELMFEIAVPQATAGALALHYQIEPGWGVGDMAEIIPILDLLGIPVRGIPFAKDLPPSALGEHTVEQLDMMTDRAWRNAVAYYMMSVDPEDVKNPFEFGSLDARVFNLMLAVVGRTELETFVHTAGEYADTDVGRYETYEFIQGVEQEARTQDVVIARLRDGAYKVAGVRHIM